MEFYLDIDKSGPNWLYSLRLREWAEQPVGIQVATFNPHVLVQNPGLADKIVATLNSELASDKE